MRPGQSRYRSWISWMGDRFFCTPLRLYRFSFLCSLVHTGYGGLSSLVGRPRMGRFSFTYIQSPC